MIVFAAYTPHSPLLLDSIGKEHVAKLQATRAAIEKVSTDLRAARPDALVMFSSHNCLLDSAFSINLHDRYDVNLSAFGDVATRRSFVPDVALADAVQRRARRAGLRVALCTDEHLDYGTSVPLLLLYPTQACPKILPIAYSGLSPQEHHAFGSALQDVLVHTPQRVAIIASGDLSHALSSDAPEGLHPAGKTFDTAAVAALRRMDTQKLLGLDPADVEAASECGYKPLLMLLGVLEGMHVKPKVLAYEAPFGVGLLTAELPLA